MQAVAFRVDGDLARPRESCGERDEIGFGLDERTGGRRETRAR